MKHPNKRWTPERKLRYKQTMANKRVGKLAGENGQALNDTDVQCICRTIAEIQKLTQAGRSYIAQRLQADSI